ncbi:MAG: ABC transporter ATP-binding protein/permease [Gammaproteobacteria bacterium]|nr:ABC transporter ATP-binding protein/permease [Gammaproteobacteria bacterium]MCH9743609.1 ABC transporter ATP-binding protein/permease [Gammaproteobacteria bacterium]
MANYVKNISRGYNAIDSSGSAFIFWTGVFIKVATVISRAGTFLLLEGITDDFSRIDNTKDCFRVDDEERVTGFLIGYAVLWTVTEVTRILGSKLIGYATTSAAEVLSQRTAENMLSRDMTFHDKRENDVDTKINITSSAYYAVNQQFSGILDYTFLTLELWAILIIAFAKNVFDPAVTGGGVALWLVYSAVSYGVNGYQEKAEGEKIDAENVKIGQLSESYRGIEAIKYAASEKHEAGKYSNVQKNYVKRYKEEQNVENNIQVAQSVLLGVALLLVTLKTGTDVLDSSKRITPEDFILMNTYLLMFMYPLMQIADAVSSFRRSQPHFERFEPYMDTVELGRPDDEVHAHNQIGVHFDDVTFRYTDDGPIILNQLSFRLAPGKMVALVGASGSGKSTITKLLTKLYRPVTGAVTVTDPENTAIDAKEEIIYNIGTVPQKVTIFTRNGMDDATLRYNLSYGERHQPDQAHLNHVIRQVRLSNFVARRGGNLDFSMKGGKVSGGEAQRLGIARVMLKRPGLYILDESIAGLDPNTAHEFITAFNEAIRDTQATLLIISHDLRSVQGADEILMLNENHGDGNGYSVDDIDKGTHAELMGEVPRQVDIDAAGVGGGEVPPRPSPRYFEFYNQQNYQFRRPNPQPAEYA